MRKFLHQSGWPQVFSSIALFGFLVQALTGVLLAVHYTPAPGDAYNSLRAFITEVNGGRLVRNLHYWGSSLILVAVTLHLILVFVEGAYKKPRQATWFTGVALLLLTFAFAVSGNLLPWDNRAYWGTLVSTRYWGSFLPGSNGNSIGAVTLSRFYKSHISLLPALTVLLMAVHVFWVRRDPQQEAKPIKIYPRQVFKDTAGVFTWFAVLLALAIFARVPLGHMADPMELNYLPRREWYFLFLKFFEGPLQVLGTVLPALAILALLLVPMFDRAKHDSAKLPNMQKRMHAMALVVLVFLGWGGLTAVAVATTPHSNETDMSALESWQELPAGDLASIGFFRQAKCNTCHAIANQNGGSTSAGPDLTASVSVLPTEWLGEHFRKSSQDLSELQIQLLVRFVTQRSDKAADAWATTPQYAVDGAVLFQANDCGSCHKINGVGDDLGPPLNAVGERRSRQWITDHFKAPSKLVANSLMPPFQFKVRDLKLITGYIMSIP